MAAVHKHVDHDHWPDDYDRYFKKYTKRYFGPHVDWRWVKAQGIAESGLDPDAVSPVGAVGIMQLMPATYEEIQRKNHFLTDINDPGWNIAAGVFYDRQMYRKWKKRKEVPSGERLYFAFASYNAGLGNVLRAYRKAEQEHGKINAWRQVDAYAPRETRNYVKRIRALMQVDPDS